MIFWSILIVLAGAIAFITIRWFKKNFGKELAGMHKVFQELGALLWLFWCWHYPIRWRVRYLLGNAVGKTAVGFLLLGAFYIVVEFILIIAKSIISHGEAASADASHIADHSVENKNEGFSLVLLPKIYSLPLWLEITLLLLALLVFWHHWQEWRLRKREAAIPSVLANTITQWRAIVGVNPRNPNDIENLFSIVISALLQLLHVGRKANQNFFISLMEVSADKKTLKISRAHYPTNQLPQNLIGTALSIDESAAGACYRGNVPLYVPSTKHLAGINVGTFEPAGLVYKPIPNVDMGPSLLCIPISLNGQVIGILNISGEKQDSFSLLDIEISILMATLLIDVL